MNPNGLNPRVRSAHTVALGLSVCTLLVGCLLAYAQGGNNTLTFDNQSGDDAVVKVVGPIEPPKASGSVIPPNGPVQVIQLALGDRLTIHVASGTFLILVRYGSDPAAYTYSCGGPVNQQESEGHHSAVTITLRKVQRSSSFAEAEQAFNHASSVASASENGTANPGQPRALEADVLFWKSIKDSNDPKLFEDYLLKFPNGT